MSIRDLALKKLAGAPSEGMFHVPPLRNGTWNKPVPPVPAVGTALEQRPAIDLDERAAISEYEGGLPRVHAEALAALQAIAPPPGVSSAQMAAIINLAARRLDGLRENGRLA